jgi:hypothetical protein
MFFMLVLLFGSMSAAFPLTAEALNYIPEAVKGQKSPADFHARITMGRPGIAADFRR